jgi:3-oxoacyl-[acyl-carrier protein] reductase
VAENALLITGASSEIGRALMTRFCDKPDYPTILAHSFEGTGRLHQIADRLGPRNKIIPLQADFRKQADVAEMAHRILNEYGAPRGIVHLPAKRLRYERFAKLDWSRLEADLTIQLQSIITILQILLPSLRRSPNSNPVLGGTQARIVFVLSSVTVSAPPKYLTAYTVVKSALLGLMRSLAVEYGAEGLNINAVSPSMVETQFLAEIPAKAIEMAAGANPRGRNATVDDVCGSIEFLLSDAADFINGVNIPVMGGLSL